MKTLIKLILFIPYLLLWVLYFMLTLQQRNEYHISLQKGMLCTGSRRDGDHVEYFFNPRLPPKRKYITWEQYWHARGYNF